MTHTPRTLPRWRALLLGLSGAALLGCSTEAANRIVITPSGTAEVSVLNSNLQGECELKTGSALYEDKILTAWVQLQSHKDVKQTLEGRWTFEDRDGFVLKGTRAWKSVFVNAQEEQRVEGRAPSPQAVRAIYELRYHSGQTDGDE
ncbi:MAG: DUF1425 domain-containing protein [Planctomycetota bacterium]